MTYTRNTSQFWPYIPVPSTLGSLTLLAWAVCAPLIGLGGGLCTSAYAAEANSTLPSTSANATGAANATALSFAQNASNPVGAVNGTSLAPTANATLPLPGATNATTPMPGTSDATVAIPATGNATLPLTGTANATATEALAGLDPAWSPLLDRLEAEGFSRDALNTLFARLGESSYSPSFMAAKILELYGVGGIGLAHDETPPLPPVGYERPIPDITVGDYKTFKVKYAAEISDILEKHGVPVNVIVAVLLVETGLGSDLGNTTALRALASMAATTTPELLGSKGNGSQGKRINGGKLKATLKDKSDWAFNEVVALLHYGEANNIDVTAMPGSMYGAMGICQFMPSNIEPYALDGDGNGVVDLFSVVDAMYSVANYLEAHGWRNAKTDDLKFNALLAYNQDSIYAGRVLAIARQLALADKGKLADNRNPMYGPGTMTPRSLDPSLRRLRPVPASARVKSLGSYEDLLK